MSEEQFADLIKTGDIDALQAALDAEPALANRPVRWHLNQDNESDPLHYVSDCVGHGWLDGDTAGAVAGLLLANGAAVNGSDGRESPLIASVSLGASRVAEVLVEAGAALETTSIFGARALHWAAWMGTPATVTLLLSHGAEIEPRCTQYGATPLFWAVHGYGPNGPAPKTGQVAAARILIDAGADIATSNKQGLSLLELAKQCKGDEMYAMLRQYPTS